MQQPLPTMHDKGTVITCNNVHFGHTYHAYRLKLTFQSLNFKVVYLKKFYPRLIIQLIGISKIHAYIKES